MGRKHIWYFLKDEEGEPIENGAINLYLTGTLTEATVYNSATASGAIDQSTIITDSEGFFEFYLGDQFEDLPLIGYQPTQNFDLAWLTSSVSGSVVNIQIFDLIFPIDETDTDAEKNKMVSNQLAYDWDAHTDDTYSSLPHDINPVDETNSSDGTLNKVVSNDILTYLYGLPLVSGALSVETSGALFTTHYLYASGFTPSGNGVMYQEFDPELQRDDKYPIVQLYGLDSGNMIMPVDIRDMNNTTIRVIVASGSGDLVVTSLGEIA